MRTSGAGSLTARGGTLGYNVLKRECSCSHRCSSPKHVWRYRRVPRRVRGYPKIVSEYKSRSSWLRGMKQASLGVCAVPAAMSPVRLCLHENTRTPSTLMQNPRTFLHHDVDIKLRSVPLFALGAASHRSHLYFTRGALPPYRCLRRAAWHHALRSLSKRTPIGVTSRHMADLAVHWTSPDLPPTCTMKNDVFRFWC